MFGFTVKARPRADVEIDTTAPFQSVKAAVTLYGEAGSDRSTPLTKRSKADERVLEKETQHHMKLRQLEYYKDQLKSAENAKAQALRDLQRANRTLQELTNKLETLSESKQAAIESTESAKKRAQELEEQKALRAQLGNDAWKTDLDAERERYKACTVQLNDVKQELASLRQDFDAAIEAKLRAFQTAEEAQQSINLHNEKQSQLLKEVDALREDADEAKRVSIEAEEAHLKMLVEKEASLVACKAAKEEAEEKIKSLKVEYEPEDVLQRKLNDANEAIEILRAMVSELEKAKMELLEVSGEEGSMKSYVDSMKLQLEETKRERLELEQKALEAESTAEKLRAELDKAKNELDEAISRSASYMQSSLEKLVAEAEKAQIEAEEIKKKVELSEKEAESARDKGKEAEEKLKIALVEAEVAKAEEKRADDRIHNYYTGSDSAEGSVRKVIKLSVEEFESMNKKIEEMKNEADEKVRSSMVQIEAINSSEKEVQRKLETIWDEKEAMESQINAALKRAAMAEAAKNTIDGELQKRRKSE